MLHNQFEGQCKYSNYIKKSLDFIKVVKEQIDLSKKAIGKDVKIPPNHNLKVKIKTSVKKLNYDEIN